MLLKYSFVLRIILKSVLLMGIIYAIQQFSNNRLFFDQNWCWQAVTVIGIALLLDKIGIERKHTLIYLPIKSDLSVFEWIEEKKYDLLLKKRNRRIYVDKADKWFERNDFIRISLSKDRLRLKMDNRLAKEFEADFMAVIQGT